MFSKQVLEISRLLKNSLSLLDNCFVKPSANLRVKWNVLTESVKFPLAALRRIVGY